MARRTCMSSSFARVFGLVLGLVPSWALACEADETFLFTCQTENPDRTIELCGREEDTGGGMHWNGVHYLYTTEKGVELSYPADSKEGHTKLYFSHLFRDGLYEAYLRFVDGADTYRLFYRDAPDGADPVGGVEISRNGQLLETIHCGEPPLWYFETTRKIAACDMENPFGAEGCAALVPLVK